VRDRKKCRWVGRKSDRVRKLATKREREERLGERKKRQRKIDYKGEMEIKRWR